MQNQQLLGSIGLVMADFLPGLPEAVLLLSGRFRSRPSDFGKAMKRLSR